VIYQLILKALSAGKSSALVTVIDCQRVDDRLVVGRMRFWSSGQAAGSLGEEWLDQEADQMARRVLETGKLEKSRVPSPVKSAGQYTLVAEPFFIPEELVVLGGGNISQPLVQIAALLGYKITVVDDRPAFTSPALFPGAARLVCDEFKKALSKIRFGPWCSVAIITRGHKHDLLCLEHLMKFDLAYLGMIGSRRKIKLIREHLCGQGVPESRLAGVHMPIGLDISAQTPDEIAVSIAAELIKVRRGGKARSLAEGTVGGKVAAGQHNAGYIPGGDVELLQALVKCVAEETPAVLATLVSTKGSTPRKAGAKMLIFRDGRTLGTIGGGCIEGEVRREALYISDKGVPRLFNYVLDSEVAADEGMACGGAMEVFLAPVAGEGE